MKKMPKKYWKMIKKIPVTESLVNKIADLKPKTISKGTLAYVFLCVLQNNTFLQKIPVDYFCI